MIALILCVATVAVFQQVRTFEFLRWDDTFNVTENPWLHPVTDESAAYFWKWNNWYFASYIPMTRTIWVIAAQMCGANLDPAVFHTWNLVVHTISVLLVFLILRLLVRRDWPPCLGALLFAVHPLQVEPVAWVTGMKDLLAGLFSFLAVWQYLCFAVKARDGEDAQGLRFINYGAALLFFILAMLSKSSAVSLPFAIWALDYWVIRRPPRQSIQALAVWIVAALPIIYATKLAEGEVHIHIPGTLAGRPIVAGDTIAFYLYKLFIPWPLAADYSRTPDYVAHHWWGLATAAAALCLIVVLFLVRKKTPWLLAAFGILVASILPVMGLTPFDYQVFSTVADRYIYVGMLGPAFAVAWLLTRYEKPAVLGLTTVLLIGLGALSVIQTGTWRNSDTLFDHVLAVNPRSWAAHADVGDRLSTAADKLEAAGNKPGAEAKRREAAAAYETAIRNSPTYHRSHDALGVVLAKSGKLDAAIEQFQLALKYLPIFEEAQVHLANTLYMQGKYDESIAGFHNAFKMTNDDVGAHLNLAKILRSRGRNDDALAEFHEVLRLDPKNGEAQQAISEMPAQRVTTP